jgi:hypothetical protein
MKLGTWEHWELPLFVCVISIRKGDSKNFHVGRKENIMECAAASPNIGLAISKEPILIKT